MNQAIEKWMSQEPPRELIYSTGPEFLDNLFEYGYYCDAVTGKIYWGEELLAIKPGFALMPGDKLIFIGEHSDFVEGSRQWHKKMERLEWERVRERQKP